MDSELVAGRYALGDRLGAGGMAQVFRATDRLLGRDVAVKVFGSSVDPRAPDRVRAEMRTLAGLSHPGLVRLWDAGTDTHGNGEERAFLVMQLVDGPTLAERLRSGPLSVSEITKLASDTTQALAYVHGRGVVHRDLKPANILLGSDGQARIADFGIAQTLDEEALTATGFTMGTVPYLSPEQVRGQPATPASDVFALGLVLLEAHTGRREYPGMTAEGALARLTRGVVVDPGLPQPWPGLLTAMTAAEPAARPTAAEVAEAIQRGAYTLPAPTALLPPIDLAATVAVPTARRRHRRGPVLVALGTAAVAAGAVALSLLVGSTGPVVPPTTPRPAIKASAAPVSAVTPAPTTRAPVATRTASTPSKPASGKPGKGKGKHH